MSQASQDMSEIPSTQHLAPKRRRKPKPVFIRPPVLFRPVAYDATALRVVDMDTSGERRGSNQNEGDQRGLSRAIAPGMVGGPLDEHIACLHGGLTLVH